MKTLIVCLGSIFYRDDRAGIEVCRRLEKYGYGDSVVICDMGFERCLGEILRKDFQKLIIVDAVIPEGESIKPGDVIYIEDFENIRDCLSRGLTVSTHKLPVSLVLDFIKNVKGNFKPIFIGICIKDLSICDEEFEECELSSEVEKGVNKVVNFLLEILEE